MSSLRVYVDVQSGILITYSFVCCIFRVFVLQTYIPDGDVPLGTGPMEILNGGVRDDLWFDPIIKTLPGGGRDWDVQIKCGILGNDPNQITVQPWYGHLVSIYDGPRHDGMLRLYGCLDRKLRHGCSHIWLNTLIQNK